MTGDPPMNPPEWDREHELAIENDKLKMRAEAMLDLCRRMPEDYDCCCEHTPGNRTCCLCFSQELLKEFTGDKK